MAAASAERAARRGAEAAAEEKAAVGRALSAALQETERYKAHVDVAAAAAREESAARCVAERQVEELQAVIAKQEAQLGAAGCVSFFREPGPLPCPPEVHFVLLAMWCPVSAYMNALCVCRYRQAAAAAVDSTTARERAAASTALRAEEERRQAAERSAEQSAAKAEQGALAIKQMLAVLSAAVRQPAAEPSSLWLPAEHVASLPSRPFEARLLRPA